MFRIRIIARPQNKLQRIRRYYGSKTTSSNSGTGKSNKTESKEGNKEQKHEPPSPPPFSWYDTRKYSHGLPGNEVQPPFDTPKIPTGIFRCTCGEVIGPQAGKCAYYRNPEYYSFHHMSFFDLHLVLAPLRKPQIKTGRKPTII